MARKKKTPDTEEAAPKAKTRSPKKVVEAQPAEQAEEGGLAKIQCVNRRRKLMCAHLLLDSRKCSMKTIAPGRLASVRVGKKRRCEFYEEVAAGGKKG